MKTLLHYRDFEISQNYPEAREFKWYYEHKDFVGLGDNRYGHCKTIEDCIEEIDEWHEVANDPCQYIIFTPFRPNSLPGIY